MSVGSSECNLLGEAAQGRDEALERLLEEHTPMLRRRLAGKIPRRWQAVLSVDDLVQQTYIDAFLNIEGFSGQDSGTFAAWLHTIARRNLVSTLRMLDADKRGGDRCQIAGPGDDDSFIALYELIGASQTTPSRCAARDEARTALEHALEQLPVEYGQAVRMYDLEGCSIDEVAAELHRSQGAVHMVRARAHRRLRELLGTASRYFSNA